MTKHQASILIIDDDPAIISTARLFLKQKFNYVLGVKDPSIVDKAMEETPFDVVLLDMNYSPGKSEGKEGLKLIKRILEKYPRTEIIPITAYGEINLAVDALKLGARDFITKPWQNEKLYTTIVNTLSIKTAAIQIDSLKGLNKRLLNERNPKMIGSSDTFLRIVDIVNKVAPTDANVLILGENGVGKEVVADQLHFHSKRQNQPFIKVDLGAIPDNLFESELFGHIKGAFTDAKTDRKGKFEIANGGTLFLDEIGNINLAQQAKLLSVLQNKKVTPLGSNTILNINIRVICATNSKLIDKISEGTFREDLLYRINTIEIEVPPLRERLEDIAILANHFFELCKTKYQKHFLKMNENAIKALQNYPWPGNIRELEHTLERSVILSSGNVITPADLQIQGLNEIKERESLNIDEMERVLIIRSLKKNNGNITHSARDLGIDRQALYRRLEKYGL